VTADTAVCRHADADPGRCPHHPQPSGRLRLRHRTVAAVRWVPQTADRRAGSQLV